MAAVTSAFLTYSSNDQREDLVNVIYRVEREETPFISMIERVPARAVTHEWQTQALASASSTNQRLEGAATTYKAVTATTRLTNTCEIAEADATVSGTQQAVLKAGVSDEMDYQMVLKGLELRRDMEKSLCENKAHVGNRRICDWRHHHGPQVCEPGGVVRDELQRWQHVGCRFDWWPWRLPH